MLTVHSVSPHIFKKCFWILVVKRQMPWLVYSVTICVFLSVCPEWLSRDQWYNCPQICLSFSIYEQPHVWWSSLLSCGEHQTDLELPSWKTRQSLFHSPFVVKSQNVLFSLRLLNWGMSNCWLMYRICLFKYTQKCRVIWKAGMKGVWLVSVCFVDSVVDNYLGWEVARLFLETGHWILLILCSINESHLLCYNVLIMVKDNNEEELYLKYAGVLLRIFLPTSVVLIFICVYMPS